METSPGYKIMVVAGEASGDAHAAKLLRALRAESPNDTFEFFGAGSNALRSAGMETVVNADDMAIVGLPEIARAIPMFLKAFQKLKKTAIERGPDAAILVDFPDFNLKLAKSLKKQGIPVVYYISPQLWAWRKYRIRTIRHFVDLLITILPFEKAWYERHDVDHVEYVGSPLAREVHPTATREDFRLKHGIPKDRLLVCLLPGSRQKEITRILPQMLETVREMLSRRGDLYFVIALASSRNREAVAEPISKLESNSEIRKRILTVTGETYNALNAADAAAVASGTATLETGIIGTPMVIVYKTSTLNYKLLRPLISVKHFGLINLIAEDRVATELIQSDFTPRSLTDELFRLLERAENARVRAKLKAVSDSLGHGGASARAAKHILKLIANKKIVSK